MAPTQHFRHKKHILTESESQKRAKKRKKSLKDKLRGVQRLLRQKDLPATVRIAQERMLSMLQDNLKQSAQIQKEKKMAKKYKMVKFFEKRKIARMYKSCLNELTSCTDQQREKLEGQSEVLKQQWNYVTYFPLDEKYISLFPPTPCNNTETLKHKDEIFKMIEEKVQNGEIKDASDMILQSPKEKKSKHNKTNTKSIKYSSQQNTTEQEGEELVKKPMVDDFFIDTKPSQEINEESCASSEAVKTEQSDFSVLGGPSDKTLKYHKVKRLKSERDVAAAKKKKKTEKKRDESG